MGQQPSTNAAAAAAGDETNNNNNKSPQSPTASADTLPIMRLFGAPKDKDKKKTGKEIDKDKEHDYMALLAAMRSLQGRVQSMTAKRAQYHRLAVEAKASRHPHEHSMHVKYAAQYLNMDRAIAQARTTLLVLDQQFHVIEGQQITIESVGALRLGNAALARLLQEASIDTIEQTQEEMNALLAAAQEQTEALSNGAQGFSVEAGDVSLSEIRDVFGDAVGPGQIYSSSSESEEEKVPRPRAVAVAAAAVATAEEEDEEDYKYEEVSLI